MYRRIHHQKIADLISQLDDTIFHQNKCFFGGGTAIVLLLDEYRESVDIDFLCSSHDGYRELRNIVSNHGIKGLFKTGTDVKEVRETRRSADKIMSYLEYNGSMIKMEIVREARFELSSQCLEQFNVPLLSTTAMYTSKLLANDDRCGDIQAFCKDIIDLGMMQHAWGAIPEQAWLDAEQAYGPSVRRAYDAAVRILEKPGYLARLAEVLAMERDCCDILIQTFDLDIPDYGDEYHPRPRF